MPGRGRGGSRGRGDIRSHMVPRNGQHWGAIRNINRARANRSNPIQAGPSTRATTRAATPPIQEDEWDPMDINFEDLFDGLDDPAALSLGGGASGGPGAVVGETQQIIPSLRDPSYTRVFEHYSTYVLRNTCSQAWARGPITTQGAFLDSVWTDFQCLPDHMLGFYIDDRDLSTIVGAGTRTMKILNAGWEVTASNVYQNQQVGGTDLRYANYNGADPRIYQVGDNAVNYPYWRLGYQKLISPTACTTPTAAEIATTAILDCIDTARYDPTTAPRVQFGYVRQGTGSYLFPTVDPIHTRVFEYRNLEARPATGLLGFNKTLKTWSGDINFPNPVTVGTPGNADFPDASSISGNQKKPTNSYRPRINQPNPPTNIQHPLNYKPATSETLNCGPIDFPHKEANTAELFRKFILTFPVGPMEGAPYAMVESEIQTANMTNKGNRPWMVKLQDILTPDGLETDYTVEIVIKTRMEIEMSTHALSLGRRGISLNADGTYSSQTSHYLHNYGSNNFSCAHMSGNTSATSQVFTPRDSHVSHDLFNMITPNILPTPGSTGNAFDKDTFAVLNSVYYDQGAVTVRSNETSNAPVNAEVDAIEDFKKKCNSKVKL